MKHIVYLVSMFLLAGISLRQTGRGSKQENLALDNGQKVLVSTFDKSLPKVSLKFFLESESDGAEIRWEVNDCGEQSGNPADRGRDFPTCVEASFATEDGRTVDVMVAVGTAKKGVSGTPTLFSSTITDEKGVAHSVRLIELPAKIHRNGKWLPKRTPRDSPQTIVGSA
ncbi:MAG: hypothetical protein ACM3JB_27085 [Acidobacteriaceae bacterium]